MFSWKFLRPITLVRAPMILVVNMQYLLLYQYIASASGRKFSHYHHNNANDWLFNLNEICISNTHQIIKWPIAFNVNKTHTIIKKTVHNKLRFESVMLHQALFIENSIWMFSIDRVFTRRYISIHVFCKTFKKYSLDPPNTH